jgi:hypothetical protein
MRYVVGLFDSAQEADLAVRALEELDVTPSNISVVTPAAQDAEAYITDGTDEGAEDGTGVGIAAGGLAGLLAGAATLAIPGVGPALGVGWLIAAGLGAVTGGAIGGGGRWHHRGDEGLGHFRGRRPCLCRSGAPRFDAGHGAGR